MRSRQRGGGWRGLLLSSGLLLLVLGPAARGEDESARRERLLEQHRGLPLAELSRVVEAARAAGFGAAAPEGHSDAFSALASVNLTPPAPLDPGISIRVVVRLSFSPGAGLAGLWEEDGLRPTPGETAAELGFGPAVPAPVGSGVAGDFALRHLGLVVTGARPGKLPPPAPGEAVGPVDSVGPELPWDTVVSALRVYRHVEGPRGAVLLDGDFYGARGIQWVRPGSQGPWSGRAGARAQADLRILGVAEATGAAGVALEFEISFARFHAAGEEYARGIPGHDGSAVPADALLALSGSALPLQRECLALAEVLVGKLPTSGEGTPWNPEDVPFRGRQLFLLGPASESALAAASGVQAVLDSIAAPASREDFAGAEAKLDALSAALELLDAAVEEGVDPLDPTPSRPWVLFRGLPTDAVARRAFEVDRLHALWRDMVGIARANAARIGEALAAGTGSFPSESARALVESYARWADSVPASPEEVRSLLGPGASLGPWAMPAAAAEWVARGEWEKLRDYYLERERISVAEGKLLDSARERLAPARALAKRIADMVAARGPLHPRVPGTR